MDTLFVVPVKAGTYETKIRAVALDPAFARAKKSPAQRKQEAASAMCMLRDAPLALLSMRNPINCIIALSHPEETAKRSSRRTHFDNPAKFDLFTRSFAA
jgi:hypothetical protein